MVIDLPASTAEYAYSGIMQRGWIWHQATVVRTDLALEKELETKYPDITDLCADHLQITRHYSIKPLVFRNAMQGERVGDIQIYYPESK